MKNGFTQIPNKMLLSEKIGGNEKLVLCILFMHNMDNETCFPSRPLIAKESGLYIRTVDKYIKLLEEKGFIRVDRTKKVNSYKILVKSKFKKKTLLILIIPLLLLGC